MPIGRTLDELTTDLRAEIGDSTNPSMGVAGLPGLHRALRRAQEVYYEDFDWPFMIVNRDEAIQAGSRFYTFNEGVNFTRIFKADFKEEGGDWCPLEYGIDACHYNSSDPEEGHTNRPLRWQHYETNQFELWPAPHLSGTVRFRCVRNLSPLVAGTDRCDLDSNLIVLAAAAEILADRNSKSAPLKLSLATAHYNRLRARASKHGTFILGGGPITRKPRVIRVPR